MRLLCLRRVTAPAGTGHARELLQLERSKAAPTDVGAALLQEAISDGGWLVELAGIEPASSSVEPGLLRVQSVNRFSRPRRSHRHVADRPSHGIVPINLHDKS